MPEPDAEARHDTGAAASAFVAKSWNESWNESWYLDFVEPTGRFGGYLQLTLWPRAGVSWFWACVAGPDRPLVTVITNDAPVPRPPALELRASGLWVDLICETPFAHFSVGLEAFGVALDDPTEVYRGCRGDRTPLGFDLEWETPEAARSVPGGYRLDGTVLGEVLVGDERIELDGRGGRKHRWGTDQWWNEASDFGTAEVLAEAPVILEGHPGGPSRLRRGLVRRPSPEGVGWAAELS